MTTIVEGIYKDGKIELLQKPEGLPDGPIRLMLIAEDSPKPSRFLTFGQYSGDNSTLEDFKVAEWHGDSVLDERHAQ